MHNILSPRLLFRADGNNTIGLGHIVRLLALADILRNLAPSIFLVREPSAAVKRLVTDAGWPLHALSDDSSLEVESTYLVEHFLHYNDIVILDGYLFIPAYQRILKKSGCRLVFVDDLRAWPVIADVLINHSPGVVVSDYSAPAATQLFLGPAFSLLRPPFLASSPLLPSPTTPESALVCFGGADPLRLTTRSLQALFDWPQLNRISLVMGAAFSDMVGLQKLAAQYPKREINLYQNVDAQHLVRLLQTHAVAIVPASTILIETLVLNRPAITGYYADNQQALASYVHQHQQAFSVGNFTDISPTQLSTSLGQGLTFFSTHSPKPYASQLRFDVLRTAVQQLFKH